MSVSPTFFSEPAEAKGEARNEPTKAEAEAEGEARNEPAKAEAEVKGEARNEPAKAEAEVKAEARNEPASGSESGSSNRSERAKRAMLSPPQKTGLSARA